MLFLLLALQMSTTNCTPDAVGGANCTTITTPDMSQEPAEADRGHCALCNLISIFQGDAKKRHARAVGKMLAEGNCVGAEQYALEKGDLVSAVRRLKAQGGPGLLIMGSGEIVSQLTEAGLIDEYQVVTVPLVIGKGRSLFEGVTARPRLRLTKSRSFQNGNVVSWYSI